MEADETMRALAALGEPTRFGIVRLLRSAGSPLSAGEVLERLSRELGTTVQKSRLSPHFRTLVAAGIVSSVKDGRRVLYALRPGSVDRLRQALRAHLA